MNKEKLKTLFELFRAFARVGALTFGGGPAMLPILERELVDSRSWVTNEELIDYYAVGQCTPGIIAVNTATFVGRKLAGTLGGIVATFGIVTPSVIIILIIASLLTNFADIPAVQSAFAAIRVCVSVLMVNAVIKLSKKAVIDLPTVLIFVTVLACSFFFGVSPVVFVVLSAAAGIVLTMTGVRKK